MQPTFTCLNSTKGTPENLFKDRKSVLKTPEQRHCLYY